MLFILFFALGMWLRLSTRYQIAKIVGSIPVINNVLIRNNLIQILIFVIALILLFNLFSTVLRREKELEELLDVLASGVSCLTNPKKLENTFLSLKGRKISDTTIEKFIGYFIDSFIISKVNRYDVKGKKYIGSPYKIYFEDIGLRNARLNFRQIEETHIIENIIYNELRFRGFNVDVGVVESREGNAPRQYYEIDFVATSGSKKYYIQSAYDIPDLEKWNQETKSLRKIDDSFKKIVVVRNPVVPRYDDFGCVVIGIYDFLLNENSLEI